MSEQAVIAELVDSVPLTMIGNLPCPFCGSVNLARLTSRKDSDSRWIQCERCGATGPISVPDCEAAWNVRFLDGKLFARPSDAEAMATSLKEDAQ